MFLNLINSILDKKSIYCHELDIINEYIEKILCKINIQDDINKIILNSGKRIRSILALSVYYQYYKSIPEYLFKILAFVELVHFGSLLHDDVTDKNNVRRGQQSAYKLYGAKKTILLGDYLLSKIFDEITKSKYEPYIITRFAKTASAIAYGAYLEQTLKLTSSFEEYIKVVSLKTSALFKFASTVGLWNSCNVSKIATWATCFGIIYQVQNDLNDYHVEIFENSEDYIQSNITYPFVTLFKLHLFTKRDQKNFLLIKKLIFSEKFKQKALKDLAKYLECLTNSDIYI